MSFGSAPVAITPELLAEMDDEEDKLVRRSSVASLTAGLERRNSFTDMKRRFTIDELRGTRSIEFATEFNRRLTKVELQTEPKKAETGSVEKEGVEPEPVQEKAVEFSEINVDLEPATAVESPI